MPKNIFNILLILFIITPGIAQDYNDFPSSLNYYSEDSSSIMNQGCDEKEVPHRVISNDYKRGFEYYCSGNIQSTGPLYLEKTEKFTYSDKPNITSIRKEFLRTGVWTIFYDSTVLIKRSEGNYSIGEKDGKWTVYNKNNSIKYQYEFDSGIIKTKIKHSKQGIKTTLIEKSSLDILISKNEILFILLGLLPITLLRISWNMMTFNRINNTQHFLLLAQWNKDAIGDSMMCWLIFWWIIKAKDSPQIKAFKKVGNWISIISIILFISAIYLNPDN